MDEAVYKDHECNGGTCEKIERLAPNSKMFNIHAVEFSAVEKRYMVSIGFQSEEFRKKADDTDKESKDYIVILVSSIACQDLPVVADEIMDEEVQLEKRTMTFTGSILKRTKLESMGKYNSSYAAQDKEFLHRGKIAKPAPLSKYTASTNTFNTAVCWNDSYFVCI
jgi:predicted double-glycine peptidase